MQGYYWFRVDAPPSQACAGSVQMLHLQALESHVQLRLCGVHRGNTRTEAPRCHGRPDVPAMRNSGRGYGDYTDVPVLLATGRGRSGPMPHVQANVPRPT